VARSLKMLLLLGAALLVLAAGGCGGDDDGGGGGEGGTIIHGTTDTPVSYDPAGSYDLPSWNVIYNVIWGLLSLPPGGNQPEPALAESCQFDNPRTYTCKLREGLKFHDGSDLTAEDVKHSFDRVNRINDSNGPASLFGSLYAKAGTVTGDEVEAVDELTVTFHLNKPDATWPFVMTTGGGGIVPSDTYPADKLQPDAQAIGAGPYRLAEYRAGESTALERYDDFYGEEPKNERVLIQYFDASSALKLAVENGEVDLAYRSLTPTEVEDLRDAEGVEVVEGNGTEIRYMVFNTDLEPGSNVAVRKAIAYLVDRQAIVDNVYNGTVEPLYSMVPRGIAGHVDSFKTVYGEMPDKAKAEQALQQAGVQTPVRATIWWTPTHYGDSSADEYAEIKRALDESGLFQVQLKSTEWDQYSEAYAEDRYPIFQLGWFPDFPDPDNYLSPFYHTENFMNNHYSNKQVDKLLADQKASTEQADREEIFQQIQEIAAEEVPIIPLWQGKQVAAVRDGITGVADTFDPSFQFRYWLIAKE
jgi:peptide/nickel transport system substrate-binding protein